MNFYQFMENNPWLTFFLAVIIACTITDVASYISKAINRKDKNK